MIIRGGGSELGVELGVIIRGGGSELEVIIRGDNSGGGGGSELGVRIGGQNLGGKHRRAELGGPVGGRGQSGLIWFTIH